MDEVPPASGLEISVCDSLEGFEALAPEWSKLVDGLDALAAFGSPVQVGASWRSWSTDNRCRLHIVAFRSDRELVAVAPLVLRRGRHGLGSVWWLHNLAPFYTGFPCLPQFEGPVFGALAAHVETLRGILSLQAHWVPHDTTLDRFLTRFDTCRYNRATAFVTPLQPPAPPPGTTRRIKAWNYQRRRLERYGQISFGMVSDPERVIELFRWTLARKRAQLLERDRAPDWILSDATEDWYLSVLSQEVRHGRAAVFEIALDGQTIATQVILHYGDTAFLTKTAFDPRYADESPGWNSLVLCLDALRERGVRQADLMLGAHPQKLRLGSRLIQVHNHFRPLLPQPVSGSAAVLTRRGWAAWNRIRRKPE